MSSQLNALVQYLFAKWNSNVGSKVCVYPSLHSHWSYPLLTLFFIFMVYKSMLDYENEPCCLETSLPCSNVVIFVCSSARLRGTLRISSSPIGCRVRGSKASEASVVNLPQTSKKLQSSSIAVHSMSPYAFVLFYMTAEDYGQTCWYSLLFQRNYYIRECI